MKKLKRVLFGIVAATALIVAVCLIGCGGSTPKPEETSHIKTVTALGKMDLDGAKLAGIAVEYDRDMIGANVSADTFRLGLFTSITPSSKGNGNIGDVTKVYVNDKAELSESGGSGKGNYVIIEVFTDYMSSVVLNFSKTMVTRVTQIKDITLGNGTTVAATDTVVNNNLGSKANTGLRIYFPEIAGFKYYTNLTSGYGAEGPAFTVKNCFNQQGGNYQDIDLSYALYLPEDYNENGNYAMVTLQNPAAAKDTHPLESVLAYRSAAVYASEWAQNLVKERHGVDGLIVLVPVVTERVNDNEGTPAEYEAIVKLWDHVIDTYHVDTDYIYGSGQSVGGMIVLETNRNRDNFFAGIMLYDNQWSQNYYIDTIFMRDMVRYEAYADSAPMHYPRSDASLTWAYHYDADGNKVTVEQGHDPYNYYYLISDDNIMIMNTYGGGLSNDTWREMKYLYKDLCDYDFVQHVIDGDTSLEAQNADMRAWTGRANDALNLNWMSFTGNETSRMLEASYEWLLSQSRQTEMSREKLDLNKPFEIADEQIVTEDRLVTFKAPDGGKLYYLTGKSGAGTQNYNSGLYNLGDTADMVPGWLPDNMSWENGVQSAHIVEAVKISDTAVAVKYDVDMENIVVRLKGDKVYNHLSGEYRDDDFIVLDPYLFYDATGKQLDCEIEKIYVSAVAEESDTSHCAGSGTYVIIKFKSAMIDVASVVQRTTVRTNTVIANALPWATSFV